MRIFVTGATGVIGRRVVPQLIRDGHAVTAVGRNETKRVWLTSVGATPVTVDLFDRTAVERALGGHDTVINLATHMPPSLTRMSFPWEWRENDRVRREGSAILSDASRAVGAKRFIQESFAPIYEDRGDAWIDETCPVKPASYNRSTLDAERSAARFAESGGVGIVLRFAGFYGYESPHMAQMIQMMRRGMSPLPGAPGAYWSSVIHDDAAAAVVASLRAPSGIYNVSDDEPLTRSEWLQAAASALGIKAPKPIIPGWLVAIGGSAMKLLARSQRMSNRKLRDATGWAPQYPSAREGWRAVASALRSNQVAD